MVAWGLKFFEFLVKHWYIILISVPDYDDEVVVVTENDRREKKTNQKLFDRYYKPHAEEIEGDNNADDADDGMMLLWLMTVIRRQMSELCDIVLLNWNWSNFTWKPSNYVKFLRWIQSSGI